MAASSHLSRVCLILAVMVGLCAPAPANWLETFGGNAYDQTWEFGCYPLSGTFGAGLVDGGGGDYYLRLTETTAVSSGGSALGAGFCAETFTDVRVGGGVNVSGDDSRNYLGLAARATSFPTPQGMVVTGGYIMLYHWEDGPTRVRVELLKVCNNTDDIMGSYQPEVPLPGIDYARGVYFEFDVVGTDPVYMTGSVYEYKGGPLIMTTPTFVDTSANDPWETPGLNDATYATGKSGVFVINETFPHPGYSTTYDTVSAVSDGPAAVNPSPVDGATDVPLDTDFSWVGAAFATSRQLWFGEPGNMQMVTPASNTYDPGTLMPGRTYQWRVDQIGTGDPQQGRTWTFTTANGLVVDDIEGYQQIPPNRVFETWIDGWGVSENGSQIGYYPAPYLETGNVYEGGNSMPFMYNIGTEVRYAEATADTAKLDVGSDWTRGGVTTLVLNFYGDEANGQAPMYVRLRDAGGTEKTVAYSLLHATQAKSWQQWRIPLSEFSTAGVNLANVASMTIGFGDKTGTVTYIAAGDMLFDGLVLEPSICSETGTDLRGDLNGDCVVDFRDVAILTAGWLNAGTLTP